MSIIKALILGSSSTVSTLTTAKSTDEVISTDNKVIMDDSSNSPPSILIVATSLGAVLFVALIILIAVIILRRKKRQGKGRECPSVVRTKPLLLFPTWKKIVMIWWFRTSSHEEANYCTSASRWESLTLSKCHFSNVIFFWLNPWLTKSNIAAVPKWRTFICLEWKLISFTLYQKSITG